ncbi:DegT/DnrJ/EryC1/StrS aminotransferase family protein [Arachnia propionica]|uniref:DegT/DnrJ/EryC1/StrS family aminotransferase n=1 Tax=Arachnia propionica TaxID=1750 RepID=A0A3P1WST4_9ACTN|nr:DegT/DnrJ/EryC1/StrS family aminotransferase [Arachnia propionica]RRD49036.1 DegT/DnrJ/EryC1/StrS family aminotransferase [Arachnia propionica]
MAFLPFARPDITEAEIEAVTETMRSGWLTTGPNAAQFEKEFLEFLGAEGHAIATNSATAGLHLAFEAIGVGPGTEVLVPTWTFTATAEAVRYLGGDPVFVDVDPATLCINLDDAARKVTQRTVAIAPVHFGGLAVPNGALSDFARSHGLKVVEDAAHSFPTLNEGTLVGAHGHEATVYSFYATKTMTTGEGGMVVTPDEKLASRMQTMRLHGINRDVFDRYSSEKPSWSYEVVAPGYKYNLPDTAAALGRVQLRRTPELVERRTEIASRFDEAFQDLPLALPAQAPEGSSHAWHLYVIRLTDSTPVGRDRFIELMAEHGVGTSVHFIPLHLQPYWRDRYSLTPQDFPVASEEFTRVVSLPIFSAMSDADVDQVISATRMILS